MLSYDWCSVEECDLVAQYCLKLFPYSCVAKLQCHNGCTDTIVVHDGEYTVYMIVVVVFGCSHSRVGCIGCINGCVYL